MSMNAVHYKGYREYTFEKVLMTVADSFINKNEAVPSQTI